LADLGGQSGQAFLDGAVAVANHLQGETKSGQKQLNRIRDERLHPRHGGCLHHLAGHCKDE